MSGSWRIGRIAGIDVYVHFTFFLLLAWVVVMHYLPARDLGQAVNGLGFILALFGIVVLHELGHALAARRYGIPTRDITLLPIGGVARLERMPDDPRQELVVALAGPAVNVVLAAGIYVGLRLGQGLATAGESMQVGGDFLNQMFWVNITLAVFNMLPAFPMDGGRVLRALLAMQMDYVRATQIAASIGQSMAILFAFAGLFMNPFLLLIALFVWFGATQEAGMVQMRSALSGIPVMRAMVRNFHSLGPDDPLSRALEYVLAGFHSDFPVVEGNRLVGVLTRNDLAAAMAMHGPDTPVSKVMQRDFVTTDPREMLHSAFMKLQECGCHTLPVVEDGRLLGLVTTDHLAEVLLIEEALREPHSRHPLRAAGEWRAGGVALRDGEGVALAERTPQVAGAKLWSARGAG